MTGLRRSLHFVPGGNDRMLSKALGTNADTLILDLEDAVTPDRKDEVRGVVASWLAESDFGTQEKTVRMNPLDTPWGTADLEATMVSPPDAYVVPKPETVEGLNAIDAELSRLERLHGHPDRGVGLILIAAETPLGALNVPTFPGCPRVEAMTWGAEDLSAVLGVAGNRDAAGNYLSGLPALPRNDPAERGRRRRATHRRGVRGLPGHRWSAAGVRGGRPARLYRQDCPSIRTRSM